MIKRWFFIIGVALSLVEQTMAVTPLLNSPRPGDKVVYHQLEDEPEWIEPMSADLSKLKIRSSETMQVCDGLKNDSVTNICIIKGREIKTFETTDGVFLLRSDYRPGFSRVYPSGVALALDSINDRNTSIHSLGLIENMDEYISDGAMISKLCPGQKVIINNDTLNNVEYIESVTDEVLSFRRNEDMRHKRISRYWFAPGYRYPILSNYTDSLFSLADEVIDKISVWEYSVPEEQEETVGEDPMNEYIRNELLSNSMNNNNDSMEQEENCDPGDNEYYPATVNGGVLKINSPFGSGGITSVLISDLTGRIYLSEHYKQSVPQIEADISAYPTGVYMIVVGAGDESIICKFIKNSIK